jgi:hypothetical protein
MGVAGTRTNRRSEYRFGDVEVTKKQSEMLGNLFHFDASLFIE